jgi:PAS domain S-box-containing protein
MFNSIEEAILIATPDRILKDINTGAQKMFGYSKEDLLNDSTNVLHVDQDHYLEFGRRISEAFDKGESANFEFKTKKKSGDIFTTEHTVSLLKNDTGEAIGIVSVVRDISERRRAEEQLKAASLYKSLIKAISIVVTISRDGKDHGCR